MYQGLIRQGAEVLQQNERAGVEYLTFPLLTETKLVRHLFSTRIGGVSEGIWRSMNLSFTRGDNERSVEENFRRIAHVLSGEPGDMVASDQTHTANIRRITAGDRGKGVIRPKDYQDVDGMITDVPGIILTTFYADCVPLYFVDSKKRAIGLSHAGWKGTVGSIGPRTIAAMTEAFGSDPADVYAAIGPSICQDCYEVGVDVAEPFAALFSSAGQADAVIKPGRRPDKYQLDLQEANRLLLLAAGVHADHIAVTDLCTCCNPDYLFSHRASEGKRGNMAALLSLI
ncbi:MAG: peptidoglycan editing factor PgeF [Lachnospiraceae bacterium]|jgi:YfiH family protein|nr:peptidoglycan editing factor PgeF [Lachnospiraceae bacterium]